MIVEVVRNGRQRNGKGRVDSVEDRVARAKVEVREALVRREASSVLLNTHCLRRHSAPGPPRGADSAGPTAG